MQVCWRTDYADANDKVGVTFMSECPDDVLLKWESVLPEEMFEFRAYPVRYSITLDKSSKVPVKKKGANVNEEVDIPHANIHSCVASMGACTPFVSNTPGDMPFPLLLPLRVEFCPTWQSIPLCADTATHSLGLSTHTAALMADLDNQGHYSFESDVKLARDTYTIIAHVRYKQFTLFRENLGVFAMHRWSTSLDSKIVQVLQSKSK